MKQFFPIQADNVFTHNNWLLSDELVGIFETNWFYKEHVRWDIKRFRPDDETRDLENQDQTQTTDDLFTSNNPHVTMNNDSEEVVEPSTVTNGIEGETTQALPSSARPKRKIPLNDKNDEQQNQKRIQPSRTKKN